ncbi:hypothetical protein [Halobacterium hubeiense]|uniref:hypothetical protein n=1 Tax=Halobacterium hubeiense TaxID=1407499 RepID=UPI003C785C56
MQTTTPTIDELITRGIPGAILIFSSIVSGYKVDAIPYNSNAFVIAFLALSYTAGTFLDLHKHDVFTAPPYFRRVLYSEGGENEGYLRGKTRIGLYIRRSVIAKGFNKIPHLPTISSNPDYGRESVFSDNGSSIIDTIEEREDIEVSPENLNEIWIEVESTASDSLNRVGQNERTVYHFLLNFFISIIISVILLVYGIVVVEGGYLSGLLILALPIFAVILIEINLFAKYGTRYSKRVVKKYYYDDF